MVESGYDQFVTASINFIVAPPGTPLAVRQQLSKAVATALTSAEVAQAFSKIGALARPGSPEELAAYLTQQQLLWARNVEATRISVD
jgi:tripartite-type tricarboxylate transporter receptor subunit TctC